MSQATQKANPELADQSLHNRFRGFAAGVASGVTKLTVGHPFDTIKIRMQTSGASEGRFKGPLDCLLKTVRNEGVRALYKGATPPLIGWMFMDSLMLGTLHNTRMIQQKWNGDKPLTIFQHGLAGLAGGLTVSFVATPVEQIKSRLQVQYDANTKVYSGPIDCARQLIRNNGVPALWTGLLPTMLFRSWFFVFWSSYEVFTRQLKKANFSDGTVTFLAGGLSATAFWLGAFPSDVVKNRYMTQPDVTPRRFPNAMSVARFVYQTEGLRGFYRGFLPSFLRAFPTNASADLNNRLLFAVPKKGRLYEQCLQLLKESDIHFRRNSRQDIALSTSLPVALIFLPAADIPKYVAEGNVDLGITGQDMVMENEVEDKVREVLQLDFGKCRLCLQVPVNSEYKSLQCVSGKRIVTSFDGYARKVFESIDRETGKNTTISYVSGSVEAACALGLADGIIDLVESGETMRAAGLHDIHTLMETQSVLIANKNTKHNDLVEKITSRIRGVITANQFVLCTYNIERKNLTKAVQITPGRQGATVSSLDSHEGWVAVSAMIAKKAKGDIMDKLTEVGATDILVMAFTNCRV
ncbi:mitochondrial carrier domain-containing protein [Radiomyces spectabilis]|uniref:mitochondrial carrier domain-containing protein n=1 Tax=Radiomyces spectabilis TaxID=64574 RepID=UPI0022204F74|nr:mitochondrial carrier domain-containing protein [Radiomyces spectabilis]KAI8378059.1 mitochondrial carrier domain-containing protein [Radiomyces spectabilis]